jgi:hypothetical protein
MAVGAPGVEINANLTQDELPQVVVARRAGIPTALTTPTAHYSGVGHLRLDLVRSTNVS